jgi:hypothetical protein
LDQVAAGAAFGILFGCAWCVLVHALQPLYKALAGVPLLQQLGVKDTYSCAEPLLVEAAAHAAAAKDAGVQKSRSKKQL